MALFAKHPHRVQLVAVLMVIAESILISNLWPDLWDYWSSEKNAQTRGDLLIGTLGAAAIVTGFSGVVSIFGLSASSDTFVKFRVRAGGALKANWSAVAQAGLFAMGFALGAAIASSFNFPVVAMYLFQLALFFLLENGIRSVWLLRKLVEVVGADDKKRYPTLDQTD